MSENSKKIFEKLIELANVIKENAYSPYSEYKVGAVLLKVKDNQVGIEMGVNVENAAYGPTNCAERTAIFSAAAKGVKPNEIVAIGVAASGENFSPCGVCRQVINEFEIPYTTYKFNGELKVLTLDELLPDRFTLQDASVNNEQLFKNISNLNTLQLLKEKLREVKTSMKNSNKEVK